MKRVLAIFLVVLLFIVIIIKPSHVYASSDEPDLSWNSIDNRAHSFISRGNKSETNFKVGNLANGVANILTTLGVVIVLAGILIIGIMYMTATPDEAAKLKTKLIGLVIAGIVIVGAFGIWNITRNMLSNMTDNLNSDIITEDET